RFQLLAAAGVPMTPCIPVQIADEASAAAKRLGFPLVLKGWADGVTHKSDLGLVRLGLHDQNQLAAAYADIDRLLKNHRSDSAKSGLVVQAMAGKGVELILGVRNQPGLGSLIVVGLGGVFVELINRVAARIGPVSESEALAMLDETPAGALLKGVR